MRKNLKYIEPETIEQLVEEPQLYIFDEVNVDDNKVDTINCINKEKIKVFEAFAGYGGASFGLKNAKINYEVVGFSEIDKNAIEIFEYNFRNVKNFGDITKIKENELPDFDLFTGGFPCQPFSTVGKREGEMDIRGTLFQDIIRICKKKRPKYILLENVKGLAVGKLKPTFEKILSELKKIGYNVEYSILNTKDYGIPQNRERLWIFCSLEKYPKDFVFEPSKIELNKKLKDFLDENVSEDLYRSKAQIDRIKELHSISKFEVDEPLCYDYYNRKLKTDGICMTVTPPEHNVIRIVEPIKNGKEMVRKLSIEEHYRLMGFKMDKVYKEIKFPPNQTYSKIGKCAGNGWDINLVSILLNHIFKQIL